MADSKAKLSPIFLGLVDKLADDSGALGAAAADYSKRVWQTPPRATGTATTPRSRA